MDGATENIAVVQGQIDNLIERGLDPAIFVMFLPYRGIRLYPVA
jgi:hypothetical protein